MENNRKHHRGRREKKTKGQMVSNIILVIAIAVFLFSGYKLYEIFSEYNKGETEYENIQDLVIKKNPVEKTEEDVSQEEAIFSVDFEKLKEMNSETVAWIRFDEPSQISYPVVKGPDNDKYLHTTFEGKKNSAGTLFVDVDNSGDFTDRNTFIYGHNMKNGSMFGQLRKYKNKDFGKEHPCFYIYTPDGKEATYQVFAVSVVKDTSESYKKWYNTDEEFLDYKLSCEYFPYLGNEYLYNNINLKNVLEFVDLVFDNNLDKVYFLRQYLKNFEENNGLSVAVKIKKFVK